MVQKHPEYKSNVYLPYAQWLAENDKFEEAQLGNVSTELQKYKNTNVILGWYGGRVILRLP